MGTKRNKQGLTPHTALLQKRARDSEYRLRKAGASAEEIARVSPRVPAAEVAQMTAGQLRSYQVKLNKFNNSGGWVVIPDTGEIVPRKLVQDVLRNFGTRNKQFAKEKERIDKLFAHGVPSMDRAQRFRPKTQVYGHDVEIPVSESARTRKAWEKRYSRSKELLHEFNPRKHRTNTRFRMRHLCDKAGRTALSNKIGNLRNDYFDVLINRTGFEEVIQLMYESWATGQEKEAEGYELEAWDIIRAVERGFKVF